MLAQDTSSHITSSKPGAARYYGRAKQPKAERRLKRELADKAAIQQLVESLTGIAREFIRTANSNPVIGTAVGVGTIAGLRKAGILNDAEALLVLGFVGAEVAGNVISAVASAIPFTGGNETRTALNPTAVAPTYAEKIEVTKSSKGGYAPE